MRARESHLFAVIPLDLLIYRTAALLRRIAISHAALE